MGKPKLTIKQIYGDDADLLEGYDAFAPIPRQVSRRLKLIELAPDDDYPNHRPHFSASERLLLRIALEFRFSVERAIPSVHVLAEEADMCYQHACRCIRFLERQGLLIVHRVLGLANKIDIGPLIDKVRELMGKKRRREAFVPPPAADLAPEPAAPAAPEPAAPATPEVIEQLLRQAEMRFGEMLSARQDASERIARAWEDTGWSEEQLREKVEAAISASLQYARGRRFNLFFADLDRRAAEAQFQAAKDAALEEILDLEIEANHAIHPIDSDQEPNLERYFQLLDLIEAKKQAVKVGKIPKRPKRKRGAAPLLIAAALGGS